MGVAKVPPGDSDEEVRVLPDKVWFKLYWTPAFPLDSLGGKVDKKPRLTQRWIMGLLDQIRKDGYLKNPVIVWNHHPLRGKKQPKWLLRAGSNRVWCAEQLGWQIVPAVITVATREEDEELRTFCEELKAVSPQDLQSLFPDGGNIWANEHGIGLLRARKPDVEFRDYKATEEEYALLKTTDYGTFKMTNPLSPKGG